MLNTLFTTELATAYRDAMTERVLRQDQARSARLEVLLEGRISDTATVWEAGDLWGFRTRACSSSWPRRSPQWPDTRCRRSRAACTCEESRRPGSCCPNPGGDRVAEIAA